MEDFCLVQCDSPDAGSECDREVTTPISHSTLDPEGLDPKANREPSPAELAQCEAEVATLLNIIAELNKKMGSLKAPSEPGDLKPRRASRRLVPDLLCHRRTRISPERSAAAAVTSKPSLTDRGGGGVVWTELQAALSSVEDSISSKRSWAAPITASDQDKHREHMCAAKESFVKATQLLEEMETEFGISCPFALPKDRCLEDLPDPETRDSVLPLQSHQQELERAQHTFSQMEEEKNKLSGLRKSWRSGGRSPSYRPTAGPLSPDWASPPLGSPLLYRRSARAVAPLSVGSDGSPAGSVTSCSPCPSPVGLESETERLNRCIERLRARNERLTAALERRKGESERISVALNRLEANCSALQMALRNCEECEEAYSELLSLYDAKRQQSIPLQTDSAETVGDRQQPDSQSAQLMGPEELSTSFSTAGVSEETGTQSLAGQRTPELVEREAILRQQIERLKRDRAAICRPKLSPGVEGKMSPETCPPAGSRGGHVTHDNAKLPVSRKEKPSLFYELVSVREEMSDLRALTRLKEKELRCLEWSLMAQKAQETAEAFALESLREELDDPKTNQQSLCEHAAEQSSDGDRPVLKELQAVLQREQALKKRLALVQDSLNTALSDSNSHRRENGEQIARLTQAHSKAVSSYRQIRRKYREHVWSLEHKATTATESQHLPSDAPKAAADGLEWKREETVL